MTIPVVAVFNTSDDVVEMLRIALEQGGFVVVSAHLDEIRRGSVNLASFVEEHQPRVILYDIAPPYDRSWRFLEHVREADAMRGRAFVITTTNVARLREFVSAQTEAYEIVGKPYDIKAIVNAVRRAAGMDTLPEGAIRV